jgi:hypothetical protein
MTPDQVQRVIDDHGEAMARFGYLPDDVAPASRAEG